MIVFYPSRVNFSLSRDQIKKEPLPLKKSSLSILKNKNILTELQKFKKLKKWDLSFTRSPLYQTAKKEIALYKGIFFSLAMIFLILCYLLGHSLPNGLSIILFEQMLLAQQSVSLFSLSLFLICFLIGLKLSPEKHTLNVATTLKKNELKEIYLEKIAENPKALHLYEGIKSKIDRSKVQREELIQLITSSNSHDKMAKEKLLNKTFSDYEKELSELLLKF